MTNREKLIELLTEKDGKIRAGELQKFLNHSPLTPICDGAVCIDGVSCDECEAGWLNAEAK